MCRNLVQTAYETVDLVTSGYPCVVEVKQTREAILANQRTWRELLSANAGSRDSVSSQEVVNDEQILALP